MLSNLLSSPRSALSAEQTVYLVNSYWGRLTKRKLKYFKPLEWVGNGLNPIFNALEALQASPYG